MREKPVKENPAQVYPAREKPARENPAQSNTEISNKEGPDSAGTAIRELKEHGYPARGRIGTPDGKPADAEYSAHERPESEILENKPFSPRHENPSQGRGKGEKPVMENPAQGNPAQGNPAQSNTEVSNKDIYIKHPIPSIPSYPRETPSMGEKRPEKERGRPPDGFAVKRRDVETRVSYRELCDQYGPERLDWIVELILEVLNSRREEIVVAGDTRPAAEVKKRFAEINSLHAMHVLDGMEQNTTAIRNIKAYTLAALYNAPLTMNAHGRAAVNRLLHGKT
jgi:hypothetical protein